MDEHQQLGRAKNAVLLLLEKRLSVPRIYIDPDWMGSKVDVLAFDRDGSGDVHVALAYQRSWIEETSVPDVLREREKVQDILERFQSIQAQYKYVVAVDARVTWAERRFELASDLKDKLFSPDGLGRIGLVSVVSNENDEVSANLLIKPERFRAFIGPVAETFLEEHSADWAFRA